MATQGASTEPTSDPVRFDALRVRVRVESDGKQEMTYAVAVLLRTSAAVAEFGQLGLPYLAGLGEVSFEDVNIQKPDGRLIALKDLKPEDINPFGVSDLPIAADLRFRKVTIPGLEPGDRLSYRMVLRQRPLAPGRIFGEAKFTPTVGNPVQSYELDLPRETPINVQLRGGLGAAWEDVASPSDRRVRRLSLRVPRPEQKADGPTEAEIKAWTDPDVIFTNFKSWEEVGQWWWALSRDRLAPDATVRTEADHLVAGRRFPREKIEAIHAFVASRIRYLSVGFGIGRMQPRPAAEVLANRYGDCKDKHALLAALGSAVGIDVRPALIHSARKDIWDEAPAPQQFDHMISVARLGNDPSDWLWLDGTNNLGLPGYLTPSLRDKRALLIDADGKGRVVRTPEDPPFTARTEVEGKGSLDPSGLLRARLRWTFRSDEEVEWRYILGAAPQDRLSEAIKGSLAKSWKGSKVTNVKVSDPADLITPFWVEFDVERTVATRRSDKDWELWIPLPDFELPTPSKAEKEKVAQFGVREFGVRAEVELPEGVKARAPLSVTLDRPFGQFRSSYAVEGRTLRVRRELKLSRGSLVAADVPAYDSFRKALDTDREQDFLVGPLSTGTASAETLHADGKAAYDAKNYERAVELLRKALEGDAKLKDGWNDLGRALRNKGDKQAAVEAFGKQIELEPFHEYAYAERAYDLIDLKRWDDAEKDLLKQIEVAPFKAWSYAKLGQRRMGQRKYRESAEYYARAGTIEPKEEDHWIELGWAHFYDGRKEEARSALERARGLSLKDWQQVNVARAYHGLGDYGAAGELAQAAIGSISERLAKLTPKSFDDGSRYWMTRLVWGWQLMGAAALADGEVGKAEKYLDSSWRVGLIPEAAWTLGLLRERQGRSSDSARWLSAAESIPGARWSLPEGYAARATEARKKAEPSSPADLVMSTRTVKLMDAPTADFTEEVLLLVGGQGVVESAKNLSRKSPEAFDRQMTKLGTLKLGFSAPDDRPVKLVLRGLLTCFKLTNCSLVLDMPGVKSTVEERD